MVVRLGLYGPDGRADAFNVAAQAPMPADLGAPPAWWGALAGAGAEQLEAHLRAGEGDFLTYEAGSDIAIVNVPYPPFGGAGPHLMVDAGPVTVHTFTVAGGGRPGSPIEP